MKARLPYLVAAAVLVAISVGAIVVAQGRDPETVAGGPQVSASGEVLVDADIDVLAEGSPYPETIDQSWWNSEPLGKADLAGKVVVFDYWTYSCVNCLRTLPALRSWWDRYERDGLLIIGVHSPEFTFEQYPPNVGDAIDRNDINWPVVNDPAHELFEAFQVRGWPEKFIVDGQDRLRYRHIGEGAYDETEDVIRALLDVDPNSPRADDEGAVEPVAEAALTRELYLGAQRGTETNANTEGLIEGEQRFERPADQGPNSAALVGGWKVAAQSVSVVEAPASIVLRFTAAEVNLVMTPPVDLVGEVVVTLDGEPVPVGRRGPDLTVDAAGRTVVNVENSDITRLLAGDPAAGDTLPSGVLELELLTPRLAAFAFTFGS